MLALWTFFGPEDVIIAVGQDGLVANVAKYLDGQPVVGVNPDPQRNPGVLVRHAGGGGVVSARCVGWRDGACRTAGHGRSRHRRRPNPCEHSTRSTSATGTTLTAGRLTSGELVIRCESDPASEVVYEVCDLAGNCAQASLSVTVLSVSDCTISGTNSDDVLTGTSGADVICGFDGADTIDGGDGNDIILGGRAPMTSAAEMVMI